MRVLVCGSRNYTDWEKLYDTLDGLYLQNGGFKALIEGEARGADTLAREWAESEGRRVPVMKFPADWKKYGKAAGPIRNRQMLEEGRPDLVVAFPGGKLDDTKGTKDMVKAARSVGIKTIVIEE